jgi:hypothetical protein
MQLISVRLPNGEDVDPGEWSDTPLYSTAEFQLNVAISSVFFFSYGETGSVPVTPATLTSRPANDADTNMQGQGSILPGNERIIVYSIQVEFYNMGNSQGGTDDTSATPPDVSLQQMLSIQRDTLGILHIASRKKEYCRAPIGYYATSKGVNRLMQPNAQIAGAATGFKVAYNSGLTVGDQRTFATPHDIPGGTTFDFELNFPNGIVTMEDVVGAGDLIRSRCTFYGPRKRPVA